MLDASAVANSIAQLLQLYTSTKLLNAYGPWSVVKRRVSENASCSRVMLRMASTTAEILLLIADLNCISDAYKLAFW
jgi:hypothetical protein